MRGIEQDAVPMTEELDAMMDGWVILRRMNIPWYEYEIRREGSGNVVATARWIREGDHAQLHNQVYESTPQTIKACMTMLGYIKADCKAAGVKVITAGKLSYDDKFMRFLSLAGFQYFGATMGV